MIALTSFVFPIVGLLFFCWFFKWSLETWQKMLTYLATIPVCLLISLGTSSAGTYFHTSFNEVWNFRNIEVRYYEEWNERVSCQHPIYQTTTHTDSKGNTYTTTALVGYEHPYDVDFHPRYWCAIAENNTTTGISQQEYNNWRTRWGNERFVDLHRNYHTIDGDMYMARWNGNFADIYPHHEIHQYENRVRVSRSVFNYGEVSKEIRKKYPRPVDTGDTSAVHAYGLPVVGVENWTWNQVNADLGVSKIIHILVMQFNADEYGMEEIETLKSAWKGPNKNEMVICIGIKPSTREVVWADVFSWMDDTTGQVKIRQDILDMKIYDYQRLVATVRKIVPEYWHKKSFKDFSYIKVDPPIGFKILYTILCLSVCGVAGFLIEEKVDY